MRNGLEVSVKLIKASKGEGRRFDQTTILLHWLTVLLIAIQFTSAWLRGAVHHEVILAAAILTIHRTAGMLTWLIGLMRLVWRRRFAYLPPFPESMPKLQQTMAKANEFGLYALLFLQPITGLRCFTVSRLSFSSGMCPLYLPRTRKSVPCSSRLTNLAPKR